MTTDLKLIKKLREETGAGVVDCKKVLYDADGDTQKARELLRAMGVAQAVKRSDRETSEGVVYSYIHSGGKVGVLVDLRCETDFVARNDNFVDLAHQLALQIIAVAPKSVEELLDQEYIKNTEITVGDLITQLAGKIGENIKLERFTRYEI